MHVLLKISFAVLAFLAIHLLQKVYAESLFNQSLDSIPSLQAGMGNGSANVWYLYSQWDYGFLIVLPFLCTYFFVEQRARSFYYIFLLTFCFGLTSVMQLIYMQPRPYWVETRVTNYDCSNSFGNPSGHCLTVTAIVIAAFLDYNKWAMSNAESRFSQLYIRGILLLLFLVVAGTMCYARVLLGAHSVNQVYLGIQYGVWLAFTFHWLVKEELIKFAKDVIEGREKEIADIGMYSSLYLGAVLLLQAINFEQAKL